MEDLNEVWAKAAHLLGQRNGSKKIIKIFDDDEERRGTGQRLALLGELFSEGRELFGFGNGRYHLWHRPWYWF